jgi:abequosyltransferase
MNQKLLSICIPTYNRCDVLDTTLNTLFSNPDFNPDKIEVIVSDNCSTDTTREIVAKYPLVKYYCNEKNVKDLNFAIVLGYASGKYLKLFNDTLFFKPKALGIILNRIEEHVDQDCNLFFYQNMFLNKNRKKTINSAEAYLKEVSFLSTWIANFGTWKNDFERIRDKDRYWKLQFVQVDWSYKIVRNKKETLIYFDDYIDSITPKNKGGYNFFNTFVNNYMYIIKNENFSGFDYEIEKFRLCNRFVFKWFNILFIKDRETYNFDTKSTYKIIFKKYWYEPYLYFLLLWFGLKKLKKTLF